jgi:hypothetical protein
MEGIQEEKEAKNWRIPTGVTGGYYGTLLKFEGCASGEGVKCRVFNDWRQGTPCGPGHGFL